MAVRKLDSPPSSLALYARAAAGSIPGAGMLPFVGGHGEEVPDLELELDEAAADAGDLSDYCRVCGFTLRDTMPATYPHILAFPVHMALMTDSSFPFGAVGLVHIANRIVQRRPVGIRERLALTVRATKLQPHPKGRTFTVITEARAGGEPVWDEEMTILRRGGGTDGGSTERGPEPVPDDVTPAAEWRLPGDLGRRYASVSGDRNPIHMHSLTARAFGFPRAIAHGMWTKARCVAALEPRLPDSFAVEVAFKRPILLPATAAFSTVADGEATRFAVRDARKGTPHLDGTVTPS